MNFRYAIVPLLLAFPAVRLVLAPAESTTTAWSPATSLRGRAWSRCAKPSHASPERTGESLEPPQWFRSAVVYQIFVRSFRDSNGDGIGDLRGIIEQLEYVQSLGANTLYLTPIFASPSYHGYDTTDYYRVHPDFGTNDDLAELIRQVHARGMKIVLDYVASHTSTSCKETPNRPATESWVGTPRVQHSQPRSTRSAIS